VRAGIEGTILSKATRDRGAESCNVVTPPLPRVCVNSTQGYININGLEWNPCEEFLSFGDITPCSLLKAGVKLILRPWKCILRNVDWLLTDYTVFSASRAQVLLSQPPVQTSCQFSQLTTIKSNFCCNGQLSRCHLRNYSASISKYSLSCSISWPGDPRYIASGLTQQQTPFPRNPSIVSCVLVAMETCLRSHCLAMNVYSGSTIPDFRRHITVHLKNQFTSYNNFKSLLWSLWSNTKIVTQVIKSHVG
jgi:hypothetical protein